MKKIIIKTGAYLVLVMGSLVALAVLFLAGALYWQYPDGNMLKKAMVTLGLVGVSAIVLIITIALWEFMLEVIKIDREIIEIEKDAHGGTGNKII